MVSIGDKYLCLKNIKISETHLFYSKGMIMEVLSIDTRDDNIYARVANGSNIYEIIEGLLLDENYFKLVA
jgi:hypothetical protein